MNITFTINFEEIEKLNKNSEAFFKYLRRVSKNKTPLILKGTKIDNYWNCSLTECSIPASIFYNIKLPAIRDNNLANTEFTIQLTKELIGQFENNTVFIFRDSKIEIKRDNLKIQSAYVSSSSSLVDQLEEYHQLLNKQSISVKTKLIVAKESNLLNIFKELNNSPDAGIFIDSKNITLLKETIVFRTRNTETFKAASANESLYINMYTANMITSILEYAEKVELSIDETNTSITGYDAEGNVLVKNVSAVFDTVGENPADEDLAEIIPDETVATVIDLNMENFIEELKKQRNAILTFTESRNWEAKLFKNGQGVSLGFESNGVNSSSVVVNINGASGEISSEEPTDSDFTEFSTMLPIELLENVFGDSLSLRIAYNVEDENTVVVFKVEDSTILSGKLF